MSCCLAFNYIYIYIWLDAWPQIHPGRKNTQIWRIYAWNSIWCTHGTGYPMFHSRSSSFSMLVSGRWTNQSSSFFALLQWSWNWWFLKFSVASASSITTTTSTSTSNIIKHRQESSNIVINHKNNNHNIIIRIIMNNRISCCFLWVEANLCRISSGWTWSPCLLWSPCQVSLDFTGHLPQRGMATLNKKSDFLGNSQTGKYDEWLDSQMLFYDPGLRTDDHNYRFRGWWSAAWVLKHLWVCSENYDPLRIICYLQQLYAQVMLGIQNWFWDIEQSPSSHGKGNPCNNKLEIAACSSRLGQRDHAKSERFILWLQYGAAAVQIVFH